MKNTKVNKGIDFLKKIVYNQINREERRMFNVKTNKGNCINAGGLRKIIP